MDHAHTNPEDRNAQRAICPDETTAQETPLHLGELIQLAAVVSNNPFAAFCSKSANGQTPITIFGLSEQDARLLEPINAFVYDMDEPVIIEDILKDKRTKELGESPNELIHFYAGFPVSVPNQESKVLWVASNKPGKLEEIQCNALNVITKNIEILLTNQRQIQQLKDENSELLIQELDAEIAEEKYRSIFENVQEGIFQTTGEGKFISANPKLAEIYGFDNADDLITGFSDIAHDVYVDSSRREEFIESMGQSDVIHNFESKAQKETAASFGYQKMYVL